MMSLQMLDMFRKLTCLMSAFSLLLVSGCSSDSINPIEGKQTNKENMLVENIGADMPTLDPQQSSDTSSSRVIRDLFEGLVEYNQASEIVPANAKSWTISQDGLTYTFYLQEKARWSNGDPLTAKDYVYSFQRAVTPDTLTRAFASYFNPIVNAAEIQNGEMPPSSLGVKAIGKYVLEIKLATPSPTFLDSLALDAFMPVNRKQIEAYGASWSSSPDTIVGNGAYKLTRWVHNGYAEAVKNPYYWDNTHTSIEKVKYLMISDVSSDLQNYASGNESITYSSLPANSMDWYQTSFPNQYYSYPVLSQYYYIFNLKKAKFQDKRVRQALSMVIDREGLTKGVLRQGQEPAYIVLPNKISNGRYEGLWKEIPGYEWVGQDMSQRIKEAKSLLKAAGYTPENPLTLTINFNTNDANRDIAMVIQAIWLNVFDGAVKVTLFNEDWKVYLDNIRKGDFDIARMAWVADFNAPNNFTELRVCGGDNNYGSYCNKATDKIYYESIHTNDMDKFYSLQRQVIIEQTKDYPIIPLYNAPYNRLVQTYVKGFDPSHNVMGIHQTKQLSIVVDQD